MLFDVESDGFNDGSRRHSIWHTYSADELHFLLWEKHPRRGGHIEKGAYIRKTFLRGRELERITGSPAVT